MNSFQKTVITFAAEENFSSFLFIYFKKFFVEIEQSKT